MDADEVAVLIDVTGDTPASSFAAFAMPDKSSQFPLPYLYLSACDIPEVSTLFASTPEKNKSHVDDCGRTSFSSSQSP